MLCTKQLLSAPIKLEELERYMLYALMKNNNIHTPSTNVVTNERDASSSYYNKKYQSHLPFINIFIPSSNGTFISHPRSRSF